MFPTPQRDDSTTGTSIVFKCSIGNTVQLFGTHSFLLFLPLLLSSPSQISLMWYLWA